MKKNWERHERKTASRHTGKVQAGSGNSPWAKGDVKTKFYLFSCKATEKKSYSLKVSDWEKCISDAFGEDKIPVMSLNIGGRTLYVVDENDINVDEEGRMRI